MEPVFDRAEARGRDVEGARRAHHGIPRVCSPRARAAAIRAASEGVPELRDLSRADATGDQGAGPAKRRFALSRGSRPAQERLRGLEGMGSNGKRHSVALSLRDVLRPRLVGTRFLTFPGWRFPAMPGTSASCR